MMHPNDIAGIKKENPFLVPKNYFEGLPQRISDRVFMQKEKTFSFTLNPEPIVAAAVILLLAVWLFIFPGGENSDMTNGFADTPINREIISNYRLYGMDEKLVTEKFISLYDEEDMEKIFFSEYELYEEEMVRYLEMYPEYILY